MMTSSKLLSQEMREKLTHENDISNGEKWNSIQCRITSRTLYCIIGDTIRRKAERKKQSFRTSIKPPFPFRLCLLLSLTHGCCVPLWSFSRFFMLGCTFGSFLLFHYVSRLYCTDTAFLNVFCQNQELCKVSLKDED